MFDKIQIQLKAYQPISLEEIEKVKLMNRVDTKYAVPIEQVIRLISDLQSSYNVLEIASQRSGKYHSVYYDTADLKMFYAHVTHHYPRFKVRKRTYSQNGFQFLEVKHKEINGRTSKKRLSLKDQDNFNSSADNILIQYTPFSKEELSPMLCNSFDRVTLVNKARTERLTMDFNLHFSSYNGIETPVYEQAVIIELKQDKKAESEVAKRLRSENIRETGMSKYCIGTYLLNNELSYKMYKKNFVKFLNVTQ